VIVIETLKATGGRLAETLWGAVARLAERVAEGRRCPDAGCKHYLRAHSDESGCLCAVYNRLGEHERWCSCVRDSRGKPITALSTDAVAAQPGAAQPAGGAS